MTRAPCRLFYREIGSEKSIFTVRDRKAPI